MLTFGTFLEHASAHWAKEAKSQKFLSLLPPLLDSHIFWLDDDQEFQRHVQEIRSDLIPEMLDRIHLPFQDTTTVSVIRKPDREAIWTLDRLIESPSCLEGFTKRPGFRDLEGQLMLVVRYQIIEQIPITEDPIMNWVILYQGIHGNDVHFNFVPNDRLRMALDSNIGSSSEEKWKQLQYESKVILDYAAALSHPENYILSVTPELTPKEERKVAQGRPRPAQKAKHFIVVDHQVLVRMRADASGTHASPVPHERRGHWRRISERCRHARLLGKERVFVRPTIVGDPQWKGEKNFYEILPDLSKTTAEK